MTLDCSAIQRVHSNAALTATEFRKSLPAHVPKKPAEIGKATNTNSAFTPRLKVDPYSEAHVIFFMLIAKDVTVVRGKLLVILTERLSDW